MKMSSKNKSASNAVITLEVKNTLRRLTFPESAREALKKIEQICISQNTNRTQSSQNIKQMEMAMEIISEFIFCENSGKSFKKKTQNTVQRLTKIQELQLLDMLCDYMSSSSGEETQIIKNAVYMFLFPPSHPHRSQILVKLVSMSISLHNYQVLISTGILMQQVGCTTKFSIDIADGFIKDYFILLPQSIVQLDQLPVRAPLFTANLLTSLSETYTKYNERLLGVITGWISRHPGLCYTALVTNLSSSLPNGAIPMPAVTPFVGLFNWCVLAPFNANSKLYSKLHLALLMSLLECKTYCKELTTQTNIISAESLCNIISYLLIVIKENEKKLEASDQEKTSDDKMDGPADSALVAMSIEAKGNTPNEEDGSRRSLREKISESLHRLAQCIQVSLFTQTMYGNKQRLFTQAALLPDNKLLQCILSTYTQHVF